MTLDKRAIRTSAAWLPQVPFWEVATILAFDHLSLQLIIRILIPNRRAEGARFGEEPEKRRQFAGGV